MKIFFFFLIFILFFSCSNSSIKKIEPSFYYWQTTLNFDSRDLDFFRSYNINKIYLRYFDVIWNKENKSAVPSNQIIIDKKSLFPKKIIPVIFITLETLQKIEEGDIDKLSDKIIFQIEVISKSNNILDINEIQIDCDWTISTKLKYFKMLNILKENLKSKHIILSSTIRLHQIKYFKETGIPPVDKGVLMAYNTSSPYEKTDLKSILDVKTAKNYLRNLKEYKLNLDVALPIFSWAIQYDRYNKFIRLINDSNIAEIKNNNDIINTGSNFYSAKNDTFISTYRILKGDIIKVELSNLDDNENLLKYFIIKTKVENLTIILYDYDKRRVLNEDKNIYKKIFNSF